MNSLENFYKEINGDLNNVLGRLKEEDRVTKFVGLFLEDETMELLSNSFESNDYQTAFRAAHTMKGTSKELGFTKLNELSCSLTEELRDNKNKINIEYAKTLLNSVKDEYDSISNSFYELVS